MNRARKERVLSRIFSGKAIDTLREFAGKLSPLRGMIRSRPTTYPLPPSAYTTTRQRRLAQKNHISLSIQSLVDAMREASHAKSWWDSFWGKLSKGFSIAFTIIITSVLLSDSFRSNTVIIEPFLINPAMQNQGYTDQIVATKLADQMSSMIREARSVARGHHFDIPLSTTLPDVEVPAAHISAKSVLRYVQEFAPFKYIASRLGFNPIRVSGEAFLLENKIWLTIRIRQDGSGNPVRHTQTFDPEPLENIKSLFTQGGTLVLRDADPYLLASYLYQTKKHDEALAQIQYCIYRNPSGLSPLALTLWALILIDDGADEEGLKKLAAAIELEKPGELRPDLAPAYNNWGLALLNQRSYDEAEAKFGASIRRDPTYALAYNNYGKALLDQGKHEDGIRMLKEALSLDPDLAVAYYNLGQALTKERPRDSVSLYLTALKLDNKDADAYNALGWLLFHNVTPPRSKEAIENFQKAITCRPNFAAAFINLGDVWKESEDYDKARTNYQTAIDLYQQDSNSRRDDREFRKHFAVAYNQLGDVFEHLRDYDSALSNYRKAAETHPGYYGLAYIGIGDALRKATRYAEALEVYEKVLAEKRAEQDVRAYALFGRGMVYRNRCRTSPLAKKRQDLEAAVLSLTSALELDPHSHDTQTALAEAQAALGKLPR